MDKWTDSQYDTPRHRYRNGDLLSGVKLCQFSNRLRLHFMFVLEIKTLIVSVWWLIKEPTNISLPLQCKATTSNLYLVSGVFSGNFGEMLTRLPFVLYSFRMSSELASAAARNVSIEINQEILCTGLVSVASMRTSNLTKV